MKKKVRKIIGNDRKMWVVGRYKKQCVERKLASIIPVVSDILTHFPAATAG